MHWGGICNPRICCADQVSEVCAAKSTDGPNSYCVYNIYMYLRATIIYGYKFYQIWKIVDLAGINFSDFAITCSINSKMCDKF